MENPFRRLPSVSQLLESPPLKKILENVNQQVVVGKVRSFLDDVREKMSKASEGVEVPSPMEMAEKIADWLQTERRSLLLPVINGTGILLHTGLGRAPLAASAVERLRQIASGYASVEVDLETGERGQRSKIVERLLCELTGAKAAAVSNNNAAATMLALSSLAAGKEVLVSRGELVEIGGNYRLPEVMKCSGCILREVGTTNKTRISDYAEAINENTAAILRVHTSNYRIVGFTESVSLKALVDLAHRHQLPLIDDVGSGALLDLNQYGIHDEPIVRDSIAAGADLVLFSGDKLVGGPQAGILVGKSSFVDRVLANPLMRAMRTDKLTLAALQATLELYHNRETAEQAIPLLNMLSTPMENLLFRVNKFVGQVQLLENVGVAEPLSDHSMLGGGSVPTQEIPTWCAAMTFKGFSVDQVARGLRSQTPALMGRIRNDQLILDFRTIQPQFDVKLFDLFANVLK